MAESRLTDIDPRDSSGYTTKVIVVRTLRRTAGDEPSEMVLRIWEYLAHAPNTYNGSSRLPTRRALSQF